MNIVDLPDDMIIEVMKHINDNNSSISFIKSCKRMYNIGNKHGYLKTIECNEKSDLLKISSIELYKHRNTLKCFTANNVDNPHLWFFDLPKHVTFKNCDITIQPTEYIKKCIYKRVYILEYFTDSKINPFI